MPVELTTFLAALGYGALVAALIALLFFLAALLSALHDDSIEAYRDWRTTRRGR